MRAETTEIFQSKLPSRPVPVEDPFFELAFRFGATSDENQFAFKSGASDLAKDLAGFFLGFRDLGAQALKGRPAYFSVTLPYPEDESAARVHLAVSWATNHDLTRGRGLAGRQDFDRLTYIVEQVLADMVDAQLILPQERVVEILSEPLKDNGDLYRLQVLTVGSFAGQNMKYRRDGPQRDIFSAARVWDPDTAKWV